MEILSTMTFDLKPQQTSDENKNRATMEPLETGNLNGDVQTPGKGNNDSVYHTPKALFSPQDFEQLDLSKVRTALSALSAAVKEEEEQFFAELNNAEQNNLKLKQNLVGKEDLLKTNESLNDSLQQAQKLIETLRSEAETQVKSLKESLSSRDSEVESLQSGLDALQVRFDELKTSKEELERGHEEAKEKWKRLVITMKSEYDNFRESFDSLKASKKEMEESHRVERKKLEAQVAKVRSENASLSSSLDSLKICKEVADSEHVEAKEKWEKEFEKLKNETNKLQSEIEKTRESRKIAEAKVEELTTQMESKVEESQRESKEKLAAVENELSSLKSERESLQESLKALQANYDALGLDLDNQKAEYLKLQKELECLKSVQADYDSLVSEYDAQKSHFDILKSDFDSFIKEKEIQEEKHQEEKKGWEDKIAAMRAENDASISDNEGLKAKLEELKVTMEDAEESHRLDKAEWQKTQEAIKSEYDTLSKNVESLQSENDELKKCKVAAEEGDQKHQEEKAEWEKTRKVMQSEYDTLCNNFDSLSESMDATTALHAEQTQKQEKKIEKMAKQLETKTSALSLALTKYLNEQTAKQKAEADIIDLQSEIAKKDEVERKYQSDLHQAEKRIIGLNDAIALKDSEADKAAQEIIEMQKEMANKDAEILSAKCQYDTLLANFDRSEQALRDETSKNESLKKSFEELRNVEEEKEANERKFAEEKEEMTNKIASLNSILAKKIASANYFENRCEILQTALDERENSDDETVKKIDFLHKLVSSKEKELELTKSRCDSLQTSLDEAEDELEKKANVEQQLAEKAKEANETSLLVQKKDAELQALTNRCENLQSCLRKAERGVESIRTEIEKKQRDALEEAEDRVYALNQMLTKKNEELETIKANFESLKEKLANAESNDVSKTTSKKIEYLNGLVTSKDCELQLMKTRCENLQSSLDRLHESHQKHLTKCQGNSEQYSDDNVKEAEAKLEAVNKEIAQKNKEIEQMKTHFEALKQQQIVSDEFEVVLGDGEKAKALQDEVDSLKGRCAELQTALRKAEDKSAYAFGSDEIQQRCEDLEASLASMKEMYKAECERRKEAEQVFSAMGDDASNNAPTIVSNAATERRPIRRPTFFRSSRPAPELDTGAPKKSNWLSLRGRRKKEEVSVRTEAYDQRDELECIDTGAISSKWRQHSPSPHHRMQRAGSFSASPRMGLSPRSRAMNRSTSPRVRHSEAMSVGYGSSASPHVRSTGVMSVGHGSLTSLDQIPTHIKSNFLEVGFYKQRLQNIYLPVLVLGPYDVPAGPIRDDWLNKLQKNSKVMNLGVYFYGMEGDEAYGTIPWFSFLSHSKAVQRGVDKIPQDILDKIEAGDELTEIEKQISEGISQLNLAVNMKHEERPHPLREQARLEYEDFRMGAEEQHDVPECIVTANSSMGGRVSEIGA